MPNGDIVYVFQKLGLSEYESKAISALLARHDATGQQIADASEIPITKIYSVLNSLEKRGLVKCTLERPKKYRPIDPESIMSTLIGKKKEEVGLMEGIVKGSLKDLEGIYEQGEAYEGSEKIWFANSFEGVWNIVYERTSKAKERGYVAADRWTFSKAFSEKKMADLILKALNRGVRFECIIPASLSNITEKLNIEWLNVFSNKNFSCRILDDNKIFNVYILDGTEVGISFKDMKTGKIHSGIYIKDESAARGILDYFNMLWNSAIPTENDIKKEAHKALEKIDKSKVLIKAS